MNNPYNHEDCDSDFGGCGDKCKRGAYENGYTDGRKAAEKDFKELLELANEAEYFNQDMMIWRMKYADWKKARGLE